MAVHRLNRTQRIVVTPLAIIVPKGRFSSREVTIPYADISDLSVSHVYSQKFLKITHRGGTATIASSFLPKKEDFEEVLHRLLLNGIEASKRVDDLR